MKKALFALVMAMLILPVGTMKAFAISAPPTTLILTSPVATADCPANHLCLMEGLGAGIGLKLNGVAPSADVAISFSTTSSDFSLTTSTVYFTSSTPLTEEQGTFVLTGGVHNDEIDTGPRTGTVTIGPIVSADPSFNYPGTFATITVDITDDDVAEVRVDGNLNTSEDGTTATALVYLGSEPTADVYVDVASTDPGEQIVSPSHLTFTSSNWNVAQEVTITGQDDADVGDSGMNTLTFDTSTSLDTTYAALSPQEIVTLNADNDEAALIVSYEDDYLVEGESATGTIRLQTAPTANVTVNIASDDSEQLSISPLNMTFTPLNWNVEQTFTATAVRDFTYDVPEDGEGTNTYGVNFYVASEDMNYVDLSSDPAYFEVHDDGLTALPELVVTPVTGNTTEAGGTATFTVSLAAELAGSEYTVSVGSSDETEGTVSPSTLTFTELNWSVPQTITITGQNDTEDDGDIRYNVLIEGEVVATLENSDNDEPGAIDSGTVTTPVTSGGGGGGSGRPRTTKPKPQTPSGEVLGTSDTSNGTFIRSDLSSTVYFVDSNNVRHPFIDKQTYFTYSNTFNDVTWVTTAELGSYTLGKPMLPKPGVVLVKIQSMNDVYAVQAGGSTTILRKIADEAMATSLYGSAWADYVIDVEPTHFTRFLMGTDANAQMSVDRGSMQTRVSLNSK
jgi:hypothetical protein